MSRLARRMFARIFDKPRTAPASHGATASLLVVSWNNYWKLPVEEGRGFVDGWVWPHIVTAWHAAPLMVRRKSGLLVEIVEQDRIDYHGQFFFDLMPLNEKSNLTAERFDHLDQIFVGVRDVGAEQLENAHNFSPRPEWKCKSTVQSRFPGGPATGEIIIPRHVSNPYRLV